MTWGNIGLWAISGQELQNHLIPKHNQPLVNADNLTGMYSFHPHGVSTLYVDGAVKFTSEQIDTEALLASITRSGGDGLDSQ